ncbi:MAG: ferritin-like domain-containing protein, partial [Thermoleophilia bacterium]|nr:ferritin-like domain-containing protein [Thermoleophilia bacterium]
MTAPLTRRAFVGALGAGAAALAVGAQAHAATDPAGDAAILNHALALEHLQAALYTRAARVPALGPTVARMTAAMGGVERAHVAALTEAL